MNKRSFYDIIPQGQRKEVETTHNESTTSLMINLVNTSRSTLDFLKKEDCQFPGSLDWNKKINTSLDFLINCDKLNKQESYIWHDRNENRYIRYRKTHMDNFDSLIAAINKKIEEVENKLYGKKWWQFWKKTGNSDKDKNHTKDDKTK